MADFGQIRPRWKVVFFILFADYDAWELKSLAVARHNKYHPTPRIALFVGPSVGDRISAEVKPARRATH